MPVFARFIRPLPATRRAYSSFFSSKSGGGRYFNSAKPPKSVVTAGANKGAADRPGPPVDGSDGAQGTVTGSGAGSHSGANQLLKPDVGDPRSHSQVPSSPAAGNASTSAHDQSSQTSSSSTSTPTSFHHHDSTIPSHPAVTAQDFKLHQFFSLHRPLLLLSKPPSILQSVSPTSSIFSSPSEHGVEATQTRAPPPAPGFGTLEDSPEASHEADAEAARQLSRALTINHAGGTIAWEGTLRRLGLDVNMDADRVGLQEQFEKEWEDVLLDSTKRKRRKKMKKHKLKKRRRATRATRLKIG